jgi:nucleoside-diphosphate-sugar epimerase
VSTATRHALVTGGSGFVGRAVVSALHDDGFLVTVVSRAATLPDAPGGVRHVRADLTELDEQSAGALLHGIDVVVHCAGALTDEAAMEALHVDATGVLARAAAGNVTHWVQLSSVGALGTDVAGTISPAAPRTPVGTYEVTKERGDRAVTRALADSSTTLTVLMPTIVFGPDMRSTAVRRLVSFVSSGRFIHVGPRDAPSHFVFVDDVADAVSCAARTRAAGTFVVQDPSTVGEVVDEIARLTHRPPPRRRIPEPVVRAALAPVLDPFPVPGRSALRALRSRTRYSDDDGFVWRPTVGWRAGLARTVASWDAAGAVDTGRRDGEGLRITYLTTVPMTLAFFRGHMEHEASLGSALDLVSSPGDGELEALANEVGASCTPVEMSRQIAPVADLRSLRGLVAALRTSRPDVLQIATPKAALLGTLAARLARTPVVVVGVFGLPQMTETGWRRRLLDTTTRISTRWATVVWCDSPSMADYVIHQRLAAPTRVRVVGCGSVGGVDARGAFNPHSLRADGARIRRELGIPTGAPVLGFVGRLARDKGMRELGQAWRSLSVRHPDAHLVLVGPDDGDVPADARRLLQAGPRIHLVGPQRHVEAHLAAMDVFVMPSYREGFCVTNIEASALALPVVATRIPGCVDSVTDGVTGTLVPVRDAAALAEAVEEYLAAPQIARAHGWAGRRRVLRDFDPAAMQLELSRTYRALLSREPSAAEPAATPAGPVGDECVPTRG